MKYKNQFKIIFVLSTLGLLTACALGPSKGMNYMEPYPDGGLHRGLDLWASDGTAVVAARDGRVQWASSEVSGPSMMIDYEWQGKEYSIYYYHIGEPLVKKGDFVRQGQVVTRLALTGRRGRNDPRTIGIPHLHFEVFINGNLKDPESLPFSCPSKEKPKVEWLWPVGC